ncbi:hypothetical protein BDQ17DRAFT_1543001 [Cyathus striatus]|nr:hypothetical protein BDQ17DRAFT_1543001 [Cyathus striatus]
MAPPLSLPFHLFLVQVTSSVIAPPASHLPLPLVLASDEHSVRKHRRLSRPTSPLPLLPPLVPPLLLVILSPPTPVPGDVRPTPQRLLSPPLSPSSYAPFLNGPRPPALASWRCRRRWKERLRRHVLDPATPSSLRYKDDVPSEKNDVDTTTPNPPNPLSPHAQLLRSIGASRISISPWQSLGLESIVLSVRTTFGTNGLYVSYKWCRAGKVTSRTSEDSDCVIAHHAGMTRPHAPRPPQATLTSPLALSLTFLKYTSSCIAPTLYPTPRDVSTCQDVPVTTHKARP